LVFVNVQRGIAIDCWDLNGKEDRYGVGLLEEKVGVEGKWLIKTWRRWQILRGEESRLHGNWWGQHNSRKLLLLLRDLKDWVVCVE